MYSGCANAAVVLPITTAGFDWRLYSGMNINVQAENTHGQGFHFRASAKTAHNATQPDDAGARHMFLSRVCVGRSVPGNSNLRRPPAGFHSAVSGENPPKTVVIFDFVQAYPMYHITYRYQ